MPLYALMITVLGLSGLTMAGLHLLYRSPVSASMRIRPENGRKLENSALLRSALINAPLSSAMFFALVLGFAPHLVYNGEWIWWRAALEIAGVLLTYDFLYYALHRYPFHEWPRLRKVHTVHHRARYPIAVDSLFLHPTETVLGVSLILLVIWALGPIHQLSFAVVFLIYTQLNITVHCGLDLPLIGYMSRKHDRHHESMKAGNFASITPLPDLLFGTAE